MSQNKWDFILNFILKVIKEINITKNGKKGNFRDCAQKVASVVA